MNFLPIILVTCLASGVVHSAEPKAEAPKPSDRRRWGQSRDLQNQNIRLLLEHNEQIRAIHEASPVYIARDGSQLVLRGKVCLRLLEELRRIKKWTRSVDPNHQFPEFPKDCTTDFSGKIYLAVDAWLLPIVASNVGRIYPMYGANCLNTTLRALGIAQAPRYTGQAAFCQQIELYCAPVLKREDLQPGDIFAIGFHDRSIGLTAPLHSFTWISDDLVYEKGGSEIIFPGRFVTAATVWEGRKVSPECILPSVPAPAACEHYARAYRCGSERVTAKANDEIDKRSVELIQIAEAEIEKFTKLDVIPDIEPLRGIHAALEYQVNLVNAELPKFDKTQAPQWKRASHLSPADHKALLSTHLYELKREFYSYIESLESHAIYKKLSPLNVEGLLKDFEHARLDFKYELAWELALAQLLVDKPKDTFEVVLPYLKDNETDPALERLLRKTLYKARSFRQDLTPYFGDYPRKD